MVTVPVNKPFFANEQCWAPDGIHACAAQRDHWKRTYMSPKRNRPNGSRSRPSPYWEQAGQAVATAQE